MERVIGPPFAKSETVERARDERSRPGRAVVLRAFHQHRRGSRVGFDVIRLVAEALEADQVMQRLPDDARNRDLGHHPEQHDPLPAHDRDGSLTVVTPRSTARSSRSTSASANALEIFGSASGLSDRRAARIRDASGQSSASIGSTAWRSRAAVWAKASWLTVPPSLAANARRTSAINGRSPWRPRAPDSDDAMTLRERPSINRW